MRTPSELVHPPLTQFVELRDSVRQKRIGSGGRAVCDALSASLDRAVETLVPRADGVTAVAIGGYGRGVLSPYSDVDLMLLHEVDDPAGLAAGIFRPLWDAKLRVGHSVRTPAEAGAAARERFETHTTLLTSRFIAGDPVLFEKMMGEVAAVTKARPLRRHVVSEERRRREGSPFLAMTANVKTGRGGLRTLQAFEWERRRETLIGRFSADSSQEEDRAGESLVQIRNGLHAVVGRAHDEFSPELREPVARWLGVDTLEAAENLVDAFVTVDALATSRWPEVVARGPRPHRRLWSRLPGPGPSPSADVTPGRDEFVWILENGEQGRLLFERLWGSGLLDEVLPEWGTVRSLPQLAPFHEHPVGAHLWRTVSEMQALLSDGGHFEAVAHELAQPGLALLAAFLHDIGKGHGGDHAVIGARIVQELCRRLDMTADWSDRLERAVRHHLLLAETATRRDLDDPAVIDEIAITLGDRTQLRLNYLLTVADSKATGATMWSSWKASLLRTLFTRVGWRMEGESDLVVDTRRSALLAADRNGVVAAHLNGMPGDYLRSNSTDDVLWHLDLIETRRGRSLLDVRHRSPFDRAVAIGFGASGFRLHVADSFAANGIDVLEARLHTRDDGLIVDSYSVRDDRTGSRVTDERWEGARSDIEHGVAGELDTASLAAARASAYRSGSDSLITPRVECLVDPATDDVVVVVKCADRVGRLAGILRGLIACGLEIRLAKLDSRGDEVVDTFYVRGRRRPSGAVEMARLQRSVADAITW